MRLCNVFILVVLLLFIGSIANAQREVPSSSSAGYVCKDPQKSWTFSSIDVPGAITTAPRGLNDLGVIVGAYLDSAGHNHGFVLQDGTYTTVDDPEGAQGTAAVRINNRGEIVGFYIDSNQVEHGFFLRKGVYINFDYPHSAGTEARAINDWRQVVGIYDTDIRHGFGVTAGHFKTLDVPGAVQTDPEGINNSGAIVGTYLDSLFALHGFSYSDNKLVVIDLPGVEQTWPRGINQCSAIVGSYMDKSEHGFVLVGKKFVAIDYPGSGPRGSFAYDVNSNGWITGGHYDAAGMLHGYLAK
jgi:uncharacterized membrane protein